MKALINITDFHKAYDILAGSKYYYEIMNNINSYVRNIKDENTLQTFLNKYPYIKEHGSRVCNLALKIANSLSLKDDQLEIIRLSSLYHDIAQIFFPYEIQHSFNIYNSSQKQALVAHPIISAELIGALFNSKKVYNTIVQHHENLNGTGYPFRLKSNDICLEANIVRIADLYVTISSEDQFFKPETKEDSILYIFNKLDEYFVHDVLISFLREIRKELKEPETHFIAIDQKISDWRSKSFNLKYNKLQSINNIKTNFTTLPIKNNLLQSEQLNVITRKELI